MNLAQPQALKHCGKCNGKLHGLWTECNGILYHPHCFQCDKCHQPLANSGAFVRMGINMYCRPCRNAMIPKQCYVKELPQPKSNTLSSVSDSSQRVNDLTLDDTHMETNDSKISSTYSTFSQPTAFALTDEDLIHHISPVHGKSFGGFPTQNNTLNADVGRMHSYSSNYKTPDTFTQTTSIIINDNEMLLPNPPPPVHNKSFGGFDREIVPDADFARAHSCSVLNIPPKSGQNVPSINSIQQNIISTDSVVNRERRTDAYATINPERTTGIQLKNDSDEKDQQQIHVYDSNNKKTQLQHIQKQNINQQQPLPSAQKNNDRSECVEKQQPNIVENETVWIPLPNTHRTNDTVTEKPFIEKKNNNDHNDMFIPPPPITQITNDAKTEKPFMESDNNNNDDDKFIPPPPLVTETEEVSHPVQIQKQSTNNSIFVPPPPPIEFQRKSVSVTLPLHINEIPKDETPQPPHAALPHEDVDEDSDSHDVATSTPTKPDPEQEQHKKTNKQKTNEQRRNKQSINVYEQVYEAPTDPNNVYRSPEPVKKKKKKKKFKLFG